MQKIMLSEERKTYLNSDLGEIAVAIISLIIVRDCNNARAFNITVFGFKTALQQRKNNTLCGK